jgi:antitoxin CptB
MMPEQSEEFAKLRWHCRRGMRELDELLVNYLNTHYEGSSEDHKRAFRQLLELQDPELLRYLLGKLVATDEFVAHVLSQIRNNPDT